MSDVQSLKAPYTDRLQVSGKQPIPAAQFRAYNDTGSQITTVEGILVALDDLTAEHDALNTPAPRSTAIFVLIALLKDQVAKLREAHEAEWKAMTDGPLTTAVE